MKFKISNQNTFYSTQFMAYSSKIDLTVLDANVVVLSCGVLLISNSKSVASATQSIF